MLAYELLNRNGLETTTNSRHARNLCWHRIPTFHRVVLDEAQPIKGLDTNRSQAVMELRAEFRLCLTGMSIMNSIDELYPLLRFLRTEPYKDQAVFDRRIGTPLGELLDAEKDDTLQERRHGTSCRRRQGIRRSTSCSSISSSIGIGSSKPSTEAALDTVPTLLEKIMLRRMKGGQNQWPGHRRRTQAD